MHLHRPWLWAFRCRLLQLRRHYFLRRTSINILTVGSRLSSSHCSRHCRLSRQWVHAGGVTQVSGGRGTWWVRDTTRSKRRRGAIVQQRCCNDQYQCVRDASRHGMRLGGRDAAVGTLQHDRTVSSGQFGGGAGVTSIGRHGHFVYLTGSSGRSGLGPISALNTSDVTLGCERSRYGQLFVVFRAFSRFNNERNQRAQQ